MVESLERIVGFMIENCVNLEDNVICGSGDTADHSQRENVNLMKREVYQVDEE